MLTLTQLHDLLDRIENATERFHHAMADLDPDVRELPELVLAEVEGCLNRLVGAYLDRMAESDKLRRELAELRLLADCARKTPDRPGIDKGRLLGLALHESGAAPARLPGGGLWE